MPSVTLFGAGSWGTALSVHLASAGRDVTLWARRAELAEAIQRTSHNPTYLPDLPIPSSVTVTADLQAAAQASDVWAMAVPSQKMRERAEALRPFARPDVHVVSLAKGIETNTLRTMSQVLAEVFDKRIPSSQVGVLYGPSHAEEVAEGRPTAVVAAASEEEEAHEIQKTFMTDRLRVYVNTDVTGVEIAGSTKNVLAIAAGICDGVGYGDNAKAALVPRGLAEIRRLGLVLGADPHTFSGLAGVGDIVVTCMSRHSRNRFLGEQVVHSDVALDDVLDEMNMVAEGVYTTQSVHDLAQRYSLDLPISDAVHSILFRGKEPGEVVRRLMTRSAKREVWLPESFRS